MVNPEFLMQKLKEMSILYKRVKRLILVAENCTGKVLLQTIKEVRDSYDHLYRVFDTSNVKKEFEKVESHLKRAGIDACEIYFVHLLEEIKSDVEEADNETITKIIPEYYTELRPKITEIQKNLAVIRGQTDSKKPNFDEYEANLTELKQIRNKIRRAVPSMQEYIKRNIEKERRTRFIKFVITIIAGLIVVVFGYLITENLFNKSENGENNSIEKINQPQ